MPPPPSTPPTSPPSNPPALPSPPSAPPSPPPTPPAVAAATAAGEAPRGATAAAVAAAAALAAAVAATAVAVAVAAGSVAAVAARGAALPTRLRADAAVALLPAADAAAAGGPALSPPPPRWSGHVRHLLGRSGRPQRPTAVASRGHRQDRISLLLKPAAPAPFWIRAGDRTTLRVSGCAAAAATSREPLALTVVAADGGMSSSRLWTRRRCRSPGSRCAPRSPASSSAQLVALSPSRRSGRRARRLERRLPPAGWPRRRRRRRRLPLPAGVDADAVDDAVAAVLGGATPAAANRFAVGSVDVVVGGAAAVGCGAKVVAANETLTADAAAGAAYLVVLRGLSNPPATLELAAAFSLRLADRGGGRSRARSPTVRAPLAMTPAPLATNASLADARSFTATDLAVAFATANPLPESARLTLTLPPGFAVGADATARLDGATPRGCVVEAAPSSAAVSLLCSGAALPAGSALTLIVSSVVAAPTAQSTAALSLETATADGALIDAATALTAPLVVVPGTLELVEPPSFSDPRTGQPTSMLVAGATPTSSPTTRRSRSPSPAASALRTRARRPPLTRRPSTRCRSAGSTPSTARSASRWRRRASPPPRAARSSSASAAPAARRCPPAARTLST